MKKTGALLRSATLVFVVLAAVFIVHLKEEHKRAERTGAVHKFRQRCHATAVALNAALERLSACPLHAQEQNRRMQVHASILIAGLRYAVQQAEEKGVENSSVVAWRSIADELEQGAGMHVIPTKMPPPPRPQR